MQSLRFLSEPTLEMLADMRGQFARMLADAGLVPREAAAGSGGGGADGWDDAMASWNRHADSPAVVRPQDATSCFWHRRQCRLAGHDPTPQQRSFMLLGCFAPAAVGEELADSCHTVYLVDEAGHAAEV